MKNNTLILGGIATILGVGVYMYWKSKQPKVAEISNLDKSQASTLSSGSSSISSSSTSSVPNISPLSGSTSATNQQGGTTNQTTTSTIVDIPVNTPIAQVAVNQTVLDENQKYLQALAIQARYVNIASSNIASKCKSSSSGLFANLGLDTCKMSYNIAAATSINKEINPLGYKLKSNNSPNSTIVKITI